MDNQKRVPPSMPTSTKRVLNNKRIVNKNTTKVPVAHKKEVKEEIKVEEPVEEIVKEEPVVETPVEKPVSNVMVFAPITRKKTHYEEPEEVVAPKSTAKGQPVYALDQENLEQLIDVIAAALSEKFVTKDEVPTIVEHTLQKMIVANNVNDMAANKQEPVVEEHKPSVPIVVRKNTAKPSRKKR